MSALEKLFGGEELSEAEWYSLIIDDEHGEEIRAEALSRRDSVYGRRIFARGLIEFTSYCRNDCLYCGLRCSNRKAERYRLSSEEILSSAENGYKAGFRTFVLQGGEDPYFTDQRLTGIVSELRASFPEAAITLSVGERSYESYKALKEAGADRYLLRHETADREHYSYLHPSSMSFDNRIRCLYDLKALGYQTGAGMIVGSPHSSARTLSEDMVFLSRLRPEMVGIGPFIPHKDTPFRSEERGSVELTLRMLSLVRLMNPHVLLPSTTALGTADENGHIRGFEAGANVIMPNLTPQRERRKYLLYNGKKITGEEAAENIGHLRAELAAHGYELSMERGDYR